MRAILLRTPSPLPGFGPAFALMTTALALVVLGPLAALLARGLEAGPAAFWAEVTAPRTLAALGLSFRAALIASAINLPLGLALAWALSRYRFPGRRLLDAAVDLPFALPTAVAGVALCALYAPNGVFGAALAPLGVQVAYAEAGVWVALVFVGLPFVTRTVQPVIAELSREEEEASATLGASRARTLARVVAPALTPALLTGFALALARSAGEYGSVIFIAGNAPYRTEIAPLLIVIRLEEFDYDAAAAIGVAMLAASFAMLLAINVLQVWSRRRIGDV